LKNKVFIILFNHLSVRGCLIIKFISGLVVEKGLLNNKT